MSQRQYFNEVNIMNVIYQIFFTNLNDRRFFLLNESITVVKHFKDRAKTFEMIYCFTNRFLTNFNALLNLFPKKKRFCRFLILHEY